MPSTSDILSTTGAILFAVALLTLLIICPIITAMKGKGGVFVLGIMFHPCWAFGAIRLAKPDSYWARRFYGPDKIRLARIRFSPNVTTRNVTAQNEIESLPRERLTTRADTSIDHPE